MNRTNSLFSRTYKLQYEEKSMHNFDDMCLCIDGISPFSQSEVMLMYNQISIPYFQMHYRILSIMRYKQNNYL